MLRQWTCPRINLAPRTSPNSSSTPSAKSRRRHSLENGLLFGVERTPPLRMSACTLESGRISAWCRTSLPSQARTRRKPPDQEIFQSTVSSKTFRGKYFSSHRPRHSKCFGRRLRRSVMVASVISAAVSWGCARQSSWGSEPSWIPPSLIFTGFFAKRPFLPCIQDTANIPSP